MISICISCILVVIIVNITASYGKFRGCYDESQRLQSGELGLISTMNYTENYDKLVDCEWLITVPATKFIKLEFDDDFVVEKNNITGLCHDTVTVFNGSNSNSEKIGEFCGKDAPRPIILNSNQALVTFKSDSSVQPYGFGIVWSAVDQLNECKSARAQSGERGSFSSINYPENSTDIHCEWLINVPASKKIKLIFNEDFDLPKSELTGGCLASVMVYKASLNFMKKRIGEYCGKNFPRQIFVNSNEAFITYESSEKSRFSVQWEAVDILINESTVLDRNCNSQRLQYGEKGNFSSMNYPENYDSSAKCEWLITVPTGKFIKLTFDKRSCLESYFWLNILYCVDTVTVFKGSDSNGEKIGYYCGIDFSKPIYLKSNQAFVIFESDRYDEYRGFKIYWEAVDSVTKESKDSVTRKQRLTKMK